MPFPYYGKTSINSKKNAIKWYLTEVSWAPKKSDQVAKADPQIQELIKQMQSRNQGGEQKVRILESLKRFGDNTDLLSEQANMVANAIVSGVGIGMCLVTQYAKSSGLTILRQLNEASKLPINSKGRI